MKTAYISITVLDMIFEEDYLDASDVPFEQSVEEYAQKIAQQISDEGFAVNDVEINYS